MNFELRAPECVNLAGQETGRAHLSHTSLSTLLACQERFNLHYEQRLRPAVTAKPLSMGAAFATALELNDPERAWSHVIAQSEQEAEHAAGSPWLVTPDREQVEIDAQIAQEAARCYLDHYGSHEMREHEMRVRIRNPRVGGRYSLSHDLLGRVDAVDLKEGLLIEDKLTTSQAIIKLEQRVRIDRQVSIECYLIWRTSAVLISEVQYRVTRKPAIRRGKNETHEHFLDRIAEEYASRPDFYLVEPPPVERGLDDFLRLEKEMWRWAELLRECRRDGTWPRNTAACLDHGGCVYLPLCSGEPGAEHQFRRERSANLGVGVSVENDQEVAACR